jgi:hypothetical protein
MKGQLRAWPEPVWFQDNEYWSADDKADDIRNVSNRRISARFGETAESMPISRAQLLLQYLLAVDVSPLEPR